MVRKMGEGAPPISETEQEPANGQRLHTDVSIGPAGPEDAAQVMALLRRRMAWMDEKGLQHWNCSAYLEEFPLSYFQSLARGGELFAAWDKSGMVGAMALRRTDDQWPDGDSGRALYLHHLATEVSRKGLGRQMIAWAEAYAAAQGRECLRLDSKKGNEPLRRYYDALGFRPVGECINEDYAGVLREKSLHPAAK